MLLKLRTYLKQFAALGPSNIFELHGKGLQAL